MVPQIILPLAVILSAGWLVGKAIPPFASNAAFDLYEFGKLPVIDHGRVKPVDSLARTSLQILSGKQTYLDSSGDRQPAIRWLLDLITQPEIAANQKVFRIEHPEVLNTMGLSAREGFRYALSEFADHLDSLGRQVDLALKLEPSEMSVYQKKILDLNNKLALRSLLIQAYVPATELVKNREWAVGLAQDLSREPVPLSIPSGSGKNGWETLAHASGPQSRPGTALGDGLRSSNAAP